MASPLTFLARLKDKHHFRRAHKNPKQEMVHEENPNTGVEILVISLGLIIPISLLAGTVVYNILKKDQNDRERNELRINDKKLPTTNRAGLEGMKPSERKLVLQQVFRNTTSDYRSGIECAKMNDPTEYDDSTENNSTTGNDIESNVEETAGCGTKTSIRGSFRQSILASFRSLSTVGGIGDWDCRRSSTGEENAVCSICLLPFEEGCKVTTSTDAVHCHHMFHSDCIMEWLSKNDHCPYCRSEMMSSEELFHAAKEVLGRRRVVELTSAHSVE